MQHAVDDQQRDLPLHGNVARGGLPRRVRIGERHLAKAGRLAGNRREFGGHAVPAHVPVQTSALCLVKRRGVVAVAKGTAGDERAAFLTWRPAVPAHVPVQERAAFLKRGAALAEGEHVGDLVEPAESAVETAQRIVVRDDDACAAVAVGIGGGECGGGGAPRQRRGRGRAEGGEHVDFNTPLGGSRGHRFFLVTRSGDSRAERSLQGNGGIVAQRGAGGGRHSRVGGNPAGAALREQTRH